MEVNGFCHQTPSSITLAYKTISLNTFANSSLKRQYFVYLDIIYCIIVRRPSVIFGYFVLACLLSGLGSQGVSGPG